MPHRLSFSTCWNSGRHTSGEKMLQEIVGMGFRNIELGHGTRISLMEGIQRFHQRGTINIISLHNFCPLPIEILSSSPNCYQYTSHRKLERERALKLTFRTIDFAEKLGATFVVLHLGSVPMRSATNRLIDLAESGAMYSRKYTSLKLAAVQKRERLAPLYFRRAKESLVQIAEYAASKNIHLGIESREAYEEVPNEQELLELLEEIASPYVGYWHDIGHIQIKENLAFLDHAAWLKSVRHRMFGCHLHDVVWPAYDHRAPFTGSIDYDKLVPLMPQNCLFVMEMSPKRKREEILAARDQWLSKFGS